MPRLRLKSGRKVVSTAKARKTLVRKKHNMAKVNFIESSDTDTDTNGPLEDSSSQESYDSDAELDDLFQMKAARKRLNKGKLPLIFFWLIPLKVIWKFFIRNVGKWTKEEDIKLKQLVEEYEEKWELISQHFPDRSDYQCQQRWTKVVNPHLIKGPWTKEEDDKVVELVNKYGTKRWTLIASFLKGRIGKQCGERWHNHLDPNIRKSAWTESEDRIIYQVWRNRQKFLKLLFWNHFVVIYIFYNWFLCENRRIVSGATNGRKSQNYCPDELITRSRITGIQQCGANLICRCGFENYEMTQIAKNV